MLVLTRFKHEAISIGDDITIVVADVTGDKVRLAIDAPRQLPVHRIASYEQSKDMSGVMNADNSHQQNGVARKHLKAELENALIVLQSVGVCRGDDILIALRDRIKSVLED